VNHSKYFLEHQAKAHKLLGQPVNYYAEALLALGHEGQVEPFTPEEQKLIARVKRTIRPEPQQCFSNSQRTISFFYGKLPEGRFEYVEGHACPKRFPIPIQHAWLELNGKVLDLAGEFTDYFGVPISVTIVQRYMLERRLHGPLLDDWDLGWKYAALILEPGIPAANL
jgi:hypothetical protein